MVTIRSRYRFGKRFIRLQEVRDYAVGLELPERGPMRPPPQVRMSGCSRKEFALDGLCGDSPVRALACLVARQYPPALLGQRANRRRVGRHGRRCAGEWRRAVTSPRRCALCGIRRCRPPSRALPCYLVLRRDWWATRLNTGLPDSRIARHRPFTTRRNASRQITRWPSSLEVSTSARQGAERSPSYRGSTDTRFRLAGDYALPGPQPRRLGRMSVEAQPAR